MNNIRHLVPFSVASKNVCDAISIGSKTLFIYKITIFLTNDFSHPRYCYTQEWVTIDYLSGIHGFIIKICDLNPIVSGVIFCKLPGLEKIQHSLLLHLHAGFFLYIFIVFCVKYCLNDCCGEDLNWVKFDLSKKENVFFKRSRPNKIVTFIVLEKERTKHPKPRYVLYPYFLWYFVYFRKPIRYLFCESWTIWIFGESIHHESWSNKSICNSKSYKEQIVNSSCSKVKKKHDTCTAKMIKKISLRSKTLAYLADDDLHGNTTPSMHHVFVNQVTHSINKKKRQGK
jgi:hypothetical protein